MRIPSLPGALAFAAALLPFSALGQELQSKAESWGLQNEKAAVVSGEVVDIACRLTGDCPARCGGGERLLGILQADGKLILAGKNGQPLFTGAVQDLLPYCGKKVDADGLFVGSDKVTMFQIQFLREAGAANFTPADRWTKLWAERNPEHAAAVDEWFHNDPGIAKQIEANGYLGLGKAEDVEFMKKQ
jgi:hypothetical protein